MTTDVLKEYDVEENQCTVIPFGTGLINNTWKIECPGRQFILQRINQHVFSDPENIARNIEMMGDYLKQQAPAYLFVEPVRTKRDESMVYTGKGYFRLFPFIKDSHTIDSVSSPQEAYEAALQFGRFTRLLSGFDAASLHNTIPSFHDLSLRYEQFLKALCNAGDQRRKKADKWIDYLDAQKGIVNIYEDIQQNPSFRLRVTHHDTKISNVLFDRNGRGICVIDLDTVMKGHFISDAGDMFRTYLSPVTEEEKDYSKIRIREEYFVAIVQGYLSEMQQELTEEEKSYFVYAGKFMIYMQALRFITDYLDDDKYYGQKYEGHNLVRAGNQSVLLQKLSEKEDGLLQLIAPIKQTILMARNINSYDSVK